MNIKFKYSWLALLMCLAASSVKAQAYNLTFNGRVATRPCSIAVDSVQLGDVPISEFQFNSTPESQYGRNFNVYLQGCDLNTLSTATLKFKGTTAGNSSVLALATTSSAGAKGIGVQITTNDTQHGSIGTSVKFDESQGYSFNTGSGRNFYTFRITYVRVPNASSLSAGVANATATVTLSYS